MVLFTEVSQSS